ncbi:DEAD/DEAH box helicase [Amycolatopsis albispora]|uniref:DEAD/DEAH box helicase n=1 Tax=Amycolatopsis albispora TaxID=1804986 RepID=UPI001F1ABD26|nr:DEAD/DEAH box helicase [Amycolatopsis albispora]
MSLRVALPVAGEVVPAEVPAILVEPEPAISALAEWSAPADAGASVHAWSRIASALRRGVPVDEPELPTAGHAALGLDGTTIWSARATIEAARRTIGSDNLGGSGSSGGAGGSTAGCGGGSGRPGGSVGGGAAGATAGGIVLRPYQRAGVAWLQGADGGGVLADEMGLGKTVQAIALLAARPGGPHLVVCPTSLLGNWTRELARFAPGLTSVELTSYGKLRADAERFAATAWDVVVLDEAQQIKNPDSQTARAARTLDARLRVAMTGTPVENRLDELWSLLAFTNPGLLGTRARFRRRFATAVEQRRSDAAAARLHEIVGPHILRRRKRDVAPELPPKLEVTVVCQLTAEQERLYRAAMDSAFGSGLGSGIERRGRILALLTRLKQLCNHPEPGAGQLGGRSGKLDRVTEMLTEIADNGDRALVFTQYRETGEMLARHLGAPFLHGGLSIAARERLIHQFQEDDDSPPVLVLSLRAAGFGLNLTRATHVVHYDRWWNPAVEDQASDRAHRIGQTRAVTVHTLLTERTLEETIAELHAGKRDLAGIATGETRTIENDLAKLSDERLREVLEPGARR